MKISDLSNWFIPDNLKDDYEIFRRARYFVQTYLLLGTLIFFYIFIYYLTHQTLQFYLFSGTQVVILFSLFLMRKTGAYIALTNIGVITFSILLWTQVYYRGGVFSPHLPWIGFIPILAFLFTGRFYGLIWSFITFAITITFYILEIKGILALKPDAFVLDATYYFKSIIPFFLFLFIVIFTYEQSKLQDIRDIIKAKDEISEKNELLENKNEEITTQNIEISRQRDILSVQKQEITDSILYAKRIQTALLPLKETLDLTIPNRCILFKPKDIVSGDFYWLKKLNDKIIIAVADCTGHGVPGAFMSLLGIMLLNESVAEVQEIKANEILNTLREKVKNALHQTGKRDEQKDGIDMALCILDSENYTLQYAGAYNPLYLIRNNAIKIIEADKNPIGIYIMEKTSFTNHEIQLQKDDVIYMFSDGYVDQLGLNNKKFLRKNFQELLLKIHKTPMSEQENILNSTIEEWKHDTKQVDDILVFGFSV